MYSSERAQIRRKLENNISGGIISDDRMIIVFGAGDYSREICSFLGNYGMTVSHVLDNDPKKKGSYFGGIRIITPGDLIREELENAVFIACSFFWREMQTQLISMGVAKERIITIVLTSFREQMKDSIHDLFRGRRIYRDIIKTYPGSKVMLCPYTGTGDIYLIGTLLPHYLKKNGISNYVFVVVSRPCEMVADIFPIEKVARIDGPDACRSLIKYYMVCPDECDMTILNDSWGDIYTNPVQWIRGIHGMDFTEMFRRFVFGLDVDDRPEHPLFKDVDEEVKGLFAENGLQEGKTVVLAPYATTLAGMPASFWEEMAEKLKKNGYDVCTNCGGPEEKAVLGTVRISFPLNIAPQFIERAGFFVGVRSGLCDVISGAKAKKIILYDKANYFFTCPAFDYFSLKKMRLSDDAVEIEFDNTETEKLKEEIWQSLEINIF